MADRALREAALKAVRISIERAKGNVECGKQQMERMPFDHDNNDAQPGREKWLKDLEAAEIWLAGARLAAEPSGKEWIEGFKAGQAQQAEQDAMMMDDAECLPACDPGMHADLCPFVNPGNAIRAALARVPDHPISQSCRESAASVSPDGPSTKSASGVERYQRPFDIPDGLYGADVRVPDHPPYSPRQMSESYKNAGRKVGMNETQNARLYKEVKDRLTQILLPGGTAICWRFFW